MSGTAGGTAGRPELDYARLFRATPTPYLVLVPDLTIVDVNEAYLAATGRTREELLGRHIFDAFPANPDSPDSSGVPNLRASLIRARETGRTDTMALQRYDIPDGSGRFITRYWSPVNVPVLDDEGRTLLLLHRVEDVTDFVGERERSRADRVRGEDFRRRMEEVEADLYARARGLRSALEAETLATRQLATLVDLAGRLAGCESVGELTEVLIDRGLAALGADGGAVGVRHSDDELQLNLTDSLRSWTGERYAQLPLHGPLPASFAALHDENILLPDRQAALTWADEMSDVLADTGLSRWAALPLRVGDRLLGSLTVGWREPRPFSRPERGEPRAGFAPRAADGADPSN